MPEAPPVPKRGLTIGPDGHSQEFWGAVLEALGHTVGVETWHGSIPDREISNVLNAGYDFVMMPLTLPDHASVRFAETAHGLKSPTVLILNSGTMAKRELLERLYDLFLPGLFDPFEFNDLLSHVHARRGRNPDEIRRTAAEILATASCFNRWD